MWLYFNEDNSFTKTMPDVTAVFMKAIHSECEYGNLIKASLSGQYKLYREQIDLELN